MCDDLFRQIRRFFFQLNLFEDHSTDPILIEKQRLATRIYLALMLILLLLTGLVTLTMERSITASVSSPTETTFRHLSSTYLSTLQCPCRDISLLYGSFVHIRYRFHQVCSSVFITDAWIQSISTDPDHMEMSFFWQIIAEFCRLSEISMETLIDQFNVTALVNGIAMDEPLLQTQTRVAVDDVLSKSRSLFFRNLMAIQRVTAGNQFVSALATNFEARWSMLDSEIRPVLFDRNFDGCSCLNMDGCPRSSMEGIVFDCLMINGVLQSSLKCYFNDTCLAQLHPSTASFTDRLKSEKNYQSTITTTIQDLLNRFFLDQRVIEIDFSQYYQQCQPIYCSYSYHRRFDLLYALTMIIGIFGGLKVILRFLCPIIVKKIFSSRRIGPVEIQVVLTNDSSIRIRLKHFRSTVWQSVLSLNVFDTRFRDEHSLSHQQLATRLFIFLMIVAAIISGVYIRFSIQTQIITISRPSLDTYHQLYQNYSSTLSCPCSQISIPYKKFLMINYTLHQICSSTLISSAWLTFILAFDQTQFLNQSMNILMDFRSIAPSYFQLIASVCSLIQKMFDDALHTLEESYYVNEYMPAESKFLEQTSLLNQSFTTSFQQEFLGMQDWLFLITVQSQLLIGLAVNGGLEAKNGSDTVEISDTVMGLLGDMTENSIILRGTCSCRQLPRACQVAAVLSAIDADYSYPFRLLMGANAGCVPWLGLISTNPSWWYQTDIIEQIRLLFGDHLQNRSNPIIMSLSNQTQTRFRYEDGSYPVFEDVLKEVLLERWSGELTRFDLFYQECAPNECTYLVQSERPRLVALLLLISICGGLNHILRWCSSAFIEMIIYARNRYHHQRDRGQWDLFDNIRRSLIEWNLFRSKSNDTVHIQYERRQTRVYMGLLFIAITILVVNTSLEERAVVETIRPPPNSTAYDEFRQIYPGTLECPCSRISLEYKSIISKLQVESFHPVCESTFVGDDWLTYLVPPGGVSSDIKNQDFRQWMAPFFELLVSLCPLAQNHANQSLLTLLSSSIVINRLIPIEQFEHQLNTQIQQFQQQIPTGFMQIIHLIRLSQQGNGLISVFSSNWQYLVQNHNRSMGAVLARRPVAYENGTCSCALSQGCSMAASLFNQNDTLLYMLPGFRFACTILESLLQSTLECFYSISCIDSLTYALPRGNDFLVPWLAAPPGRFEPINRSLSTFADNDTIEMIVNRMFINRWKHEISYEGFFQGCAPKQCTYTRHYRFDVLQVITTFLSVFGGLSAVLYFLVPHLSTIIEKLCHRRK